MNSLGMDGVLDLLGMKEIVLLCFSRFRNCKDEF